MKKIILFFVVALSISVFGQNNDKANSYSNAGLQQIYDSFEKTIEALRVKDINSDSLLANLKESNQLLQTQINTLNAKMDTVKNQNVRLLSDLRTLKLNSDSLHFVTSYKDSLVGADTTVYDFANKPLFGEINIYNSTAHADSQVVEYWDMFNNRWTNQLTSLKENLTQLPIALDASNLATVIIGAGISKRYIINEPYPGKVRVRTRYTTGQGTDKIYVGFIGKN